MSTVGIPQGFSSRCESAYFGAASPILDSKSLATFVSNVGIMPNQSVIDSIVAFHDDDAPTVISFTDCVTCAWLCDREHQRRQRVGDDEDFFEDAWQGCGGAEDLSGTVPAASLMQMTEDFDIQLNFSSSFGNTPTQELHVTYTEFVSSVTMDNELMALVANNTSSYIDTTIEQQMATDEQREVTRTTVRALKKFKNFLRRAKEKREQKRLEQIENSQELNVGGNLQPINRRGSSTAERQPAREKETQQPIGSTKLLFKQALSVNRPKPKLPTTLPPMDISQSSFQRVCQQQDRERRRDAIEAKQKRLKHLQRTHPHSVSSNLVAEYAKGNVDPWPSPNRRPQKSDQRVARKRNNTTPSPTRSIAIQTEQRRSHTSLH